MRRVCVVLALLVLVGLAPAAAPHPVGSRFDDGSNCGGKAPDVLQCDTGHHVFVLTLDQEVLVDPDFTGVVTSTLAWGAPGSEAKQMLTCTVRDGRGPCRTSTVVPEAFEPLGAPPYAGIPFEHRCLVDQGGAGVWLCEVRHR